MKTKILMLLLGMLICCLSLRAQVCIRPVSDPSKGCCIGNKTTKAISIQQFGQPVKVDSYFDEDCYSAQYEAFYYAGMVLECVDYILYGFWVDNNKYFVSIHNKYIIKVGSKIDAFTMSLAQNEYKMQVKDNDVRFWFKLQNSNNFDDDSLIVTVDKDRTVTAIRWYSPV